MPVRGFACDHPHLFLPMLSFLPMGLKVVEQALLRTVEAHAATVRPASSKTTAIPFKPALRYRPRPT